MSFETAAQEESTHDIFSSIRNVKEALVVYVSNVSTAQETSQLSLENRVRRRTHDLNQPSSVKDSLVALSFFQ